MRETLRQDISVTAHCAHPKSWRPVGLSVVLPPPASIFLAAQVRAGDEGGEPECEGGGGVCGCRAWRGGGGTTSQGRSQVRRLDGSGKHTIITINVVITSPCVSDFCEQQTKVNAMSQGRAHVCAGFVCERSRASVDP
ncbi:unnamed protein product [Gadus morhua 'NCC']